MLYLVERMQWPACRWAAHVEWRSALPRASIVVRLGDAELGDARRELKELKDRCLWGGPDEIPYVSII